MENKNQLENLNATTEEALDAWNDYGELPPEYSGSIRWKKPSNKNILEVYMNASYWGSYKGTQTFCGWLSKDYLPKSTKTFKGVVYYKENSVTTMKFQMMNIDIKGDIIIYTTSPDQIITGYMFQGIIDLD